MGFNIAATAGVAATEVLSRLLPVGFLAMEAFRNATCGASRVSATRSIATTLAPTIPGPSAANREPELRGV